MKSLHLKIITPERILFDGSIRHVSLPCPDGEITVLPNHISLISLVSSGEVRILDEDAVAIPLVISGGFCEVTHERVLIMVDTAERVEEIDEQRAHEAKERAQRRLSEKELDIKEYAYLVSKIEKEFARIRVARKYKR